MDKLSNPFKKGDNSDSDSDDDTSHSGKSKSLFGGKLHNPFKKGHSSDSDDDDDRSSSRSPHKGRKSSGSGKPAPMLSHSALSPQLPAASTAPVQAGLGHGGAQAAVAPPAPIPDSKPPAVARPGTAAAPATLATTSASAPAGTTDAVLPPQPARAAADAAAAPAAAAAAPAPEPKKPRVTVGGPVFGAPEILLTGVKGDPDVVMKTLRSRGFVVHLVREKHNMVLKLKFLFARRASCCGPRCCAMQLCTAAALFFWS